MLKIIVHREDTIIYDDNGNLVFLESHIFLEKVVEIPQKVCYQGLPSPTTGIIKYVPSPNTVTSIIKHYTVLNNGIFKCSSPVRGSSFIGPSDRVQMVKSSFLELSLKWKLTSGIEFSKRFYVDRFESCRLLILSESRASNFCIKFFIQCFMVKFLFFKSFGLEFHYLEINFNFSNKRFKIVYSRSIICFKYLFVNNESLGIVFPNSEVNRSFTSIKKFDVFTHNNNLSFDRFRLTLNRILEVKESLIVRGLYGSRITKFMVRLSFNDREGVRSEICDFHSLKGVVDKCSSRPVFSEADYYSCFSVSNYYNKVPYSRVLSFSTNGKMSKFCKTFKPIK